MVRLTLAPDGATGGAPVEGRAGAPPRRMRVLAVDDNADMRDLLAALLEMRGYDARTAGSAKDAIAVAAEHRPDVILMDIGMPGMDGCEAAGILRGMECLAGTVLIALTGRSLDEDRLRAHAAGFRHVLVKPVEAASLLALLGDLPAVDG